jgi:hypothetical protein
MAPEVCQMRTFEQLRPRSHEQWNDDIDAPSLTAFTVDRYGDEPYFRIISGIRGYAWAERNLRQWTRGRAMSYTTINFRTRVERAFAVRNDEQVITSSWYRKRLIPLTATLGFVACGMLGITGTALAGNNGQQINYYSHSAYKQCSTGANQNDQPIRNNCTSLHSGSNPDQGYWWVGPVTITWYRTNGTYVQSTCNVPQQQNGDFFNCYEPS